MLLRRFYAYFIDLFLISLGTKLLLITYLDFMTHHFPFLAPSLARNLPQIGFFCQYLTFTTYFFLSLYLSEGKTIGKLCTGLKVVSNNGESSLGLFRCFLRAGGAFFSTTFMMLPYLLAFIRKDGRGFHDFLGNSQTISDGPLTIPEADTASEEKIEQLSA